jgi:hypothetical protein
MLVWAYIVLLQPGMFQSHPWFAPLVRLMPQAAWGVMAFTAAGVRIFCLFRNGEGRRSPHLRALGCFIGVFCWMWLLLGALSVDWLPAGIATILMPLTSDAWSLWYAVGDARVADDKAREARASGGH